MALAAVVLLAAASHAAEGSEERRIGLPASPWRILLGSLPRTPPIDAPPFCILPGLEGELLEVALEAPKDFGAAAERAHGMLEAAGRTPPHELALLSSLLDARAAGDDARRSYAMRRLAPWLHRRLPARSEICVRLEIARLELWLRRYPEAAAQAMLAARLRSRSRNPVTLLEATDFLRAEARYFARRYQEAGELYRRLSRGSSERIMAAARLRLVDTRVERGQLEDAWVRYDALLPHAAEFGASPSHWVVRSVEALLAEGDLQAGLERLEAIRSEARSPREANLVHIRIADVLAAQERLAEARAVLQAVAEAHPGEALGALAEVRAIAWELDPRALDERIERTTTASRWENRGLAVYARAVQVKLLLERGRAADALEVLTRLAFEDPPEDLAPDLSGWFDKALLTLTRTSPEFEVCASLVERLGWRREFLLQQGTTPEPFIRLGECYEQLGFPNTAVDLYRSVAKRFSRTAVERVAFPLARAALRAGDLPVARAAAQARARRAGPQADAWRLLLAEVNLADGRAEPAFDLLSDLLSRRKPRGERVRVALLFARATARLHRLPSQRKRLSRLVEELSEKDQEASGPSLGEVALLVAEAHRSAGTSRQAERFYRMALARLPDGARREEARYWLVRLSPRSDEAAQAPASDGVRAPSESGWSALSERDREIRALKGRIGVAAPAAVAEEDGP